MSIAQLHTIADLMANPDAEHYDLIEGQLFAVSPSGFYSSVVAAHVLMALGAFVDERDLGYVTGADGGYILETDPDSVIAPDVGFVLAERMTDYPSRGFAPLRPDLAVEVRSPTDEAQHIRAKQALYARVGIPLLWWVDPRAETVTVYQPGKAPVVLGNGDVLDGDDVLPGFRLPVSRLFKR
jgi:Uma2 family endonuclease